jgi:hypothetical protein
VTPDEPRVYHPEDLSRLERIFLGVLALGLPPASLAKDASFRLDVLTASAAALEEGRNEADHLAPNGTEAAPAFEAELGAAVFELDRKGLIALGSPPGINVTLMGTIEDAGGWRRVNYEEAPRIFDKYLAHDALESLLRVGPVHSYLMRKYGDGSEVWQGLMAKGYGSGPGP